MCAVAKGNKEFGSLGNFYEREGKRNVVVRIFKVQ